MSRRATTSFYKRVKDRLYILKVWYQNIFRYPKERLRVTESLDYDAYWQKKRGMEVGALGDWQKARADIIVRTLSGAGPLTIGDIACGEGSILKYLCERLTVRDSIGYDSSDFVLEKARQIGIRTVRLDVNKEEELGRIEPADYMLLLEILEHVPHSEKLLDKAFAKSRKGVFFSFPNTGFFIHRTRLLLGRFPRQWINFPNEHLRFWTYQDLRWWLKALEYKNYRIFPYKGVPILNKIWPSLFAGGFVVCLWKR